MSPERPFLNFLLTLEPTLVASVMLEAGMPKFQKGTGSARAIDVSPLSADLLDAALRLVRLLDAPPNEMQSLQPLITREIVSRLIIGKQHERLYHLINQGGHSEQMACAIEQLRRSFDQPLNIADISRTLGMSSSGFYAHFRAVTAMSPLQFQKQLRLQEAKRLMMVDNLDATSAAFRVGYEDVSHFSRDYKRQFSHPPRRDVQRLREETDQQQSKSPGL